MGSKKVSLPETPQFQADPNVAWSQDALKGQFNYLINGLTGNGEIGGALGDSINVNPLVSQYAQQLAKSQLDPAFRQTRQDTINTLEANNQLTGSTTASALTNLDADYMASLTGMQAQYGLADVERALNNRVQLYGMGLNAGQSVGSTGLQNQQQMNQFALSNYENQVALALANQGGGNSWGAIGGGIIGAGLGSIVAPGVGTAVGAGIGSSLGNAAFGGGSSGGSALAGGLSSMGGYALGSKTSAYAPNTYSGGSESIYDVTRGWNGGSGSPILTSAGTGWRY